MISTILVGTDGSEAASAAERYGVGLAARLKARVAGISVIEDRLIRGLRDDGLGLPPPPLDSLAKYLHGRAEAAGRRNSPTPPRWRSRSNLRKASPTTGSSSEVSRQTSSWWVATVRTSIFEPV